MAFKRLKLWILINKTKLQSGSWKIVKKNIKSSHGRKCEEATNINEVVKDQTF